MHHGCLRHGHGGYLAFAAERHVVLGRKSLQRIRELQCVRQLRSRPTAERQRQSALHARHLRPGLGHSARTHRCGHVLLGRQCLQRSGDVRRRGRLHARDASRVGRRQSVHGRHLQPHCRRPPHATCERDELLRRKRMHDRQLPVRHLRGHARPGHLVRDHPPRLVSRVSDLRRWRRLPAERAAPSRHRVRSGHRRLPLQRHL